MLTARADHRQDQTRLGNDSIQKQGLKVRPDKPNTSTCNLYNTFFHTIS